MSEGYRRAWGIEAQLSPENEFLFFKHWRMLAYMAWYGFRREGKGVVLACTKTFCQYLAWEHAETMLEYQGKTGLLATYADYDPEKEVVVLLDGMSLHLVAHHPPPPEVGPPTQEQPFYGWP